MILEQKVEQVQAVLAAAVRDSSPVVFANSLGAEDMVLTDLIAKHQLDIRNVQPGHRAPAARDL